MNRSFELMIPKKIPILRHLGWFLIGWAVIIFFVFFILMSPSEGSSLEMKTGYFIVAIPESLKNRLILAAIVLPIGLLILRLTIYYRSGTLQFNETNLEVISKKRTVRVLFDNIREIQISAGREVFFFPKISTLIVIVDKNSKSHRILLRHYMESEELYQIIDGKGIKIVVSESDLD